MIDTNTGNNMLNSYNTQHPVEQLRVLVGVLSILAHCLVFFSLSLPCRRILAPGEEENLEFEEDEEGGAGAGPPDSFSARVPGGHPYTEHALLYPVGHLVC